MRFCCVLLALAVCFATHALAQNCDVDAGSLVEVSAQGFVGVLLSDFPDSVVNDAADHFLGQDEEFWADRVKHQISMTNYRFVYRVYYYNFTETGKAAIPLPPESVWDVEITGAAARELYNDTHDAIVVPWTFSTVIVATCESPAQSDPELAVIDGEMTETLYLPLDPQFLLQRTGFSCMDEADLPPDTPFSYNPATLFDHECTADDADPDDIAACHRSIEGEYSPRLPELKDCITALIEDVGLVRVDFQFTRLAYDEKTAADYRVGDLVRQFPDLTVREDGLERNYLAYKYIAQDSCNVEEGCVADWGWRRLLMFDATIQNLGEQDLVIGSAEEGNALANAGVYYFSPCHQHWHFQFYADFVYGPTSGDGPQHEGLKQAFCVQSTDRMSNSEETPSTTEFPTCVRQGITAGWGDTYMAGLDCQWIDVTDLHEHDSAESVEEHLHMRVNPDGFLCEGQGQFDNATGEPVFEDTPSGFKGENGQDIYRPVCEFQEDWDDNNGQSVQSTIPPPGHSFVTAPCGDEEHGPLRDCGWKEALTSASLAYECEPGEFATIRLAIDNATVAAGDVLPQVVRLCDHSVQLQVGVACEFKNALENVVVGKDLDFTPVSVTFHCPPRKDKYEPGGYFHVYVAPIFDDASLERAVVVLDAGDPVSPRPQDNSAASSLRSAALGLF